MVALGEKSSANAITTWTLIWAWTGSYKQRDHPRNMNGALNSLQPRVVHQSPQYRRNHRIPRPSSQTNVWTLSSPSNPPLCPKLDHDIHSERGDPHPHTTMPSTNGRQITVVSSTHTSKWMLTSPVGINYLRPIQDSSARG